MRTSVGPASGPVPSTMPASVTRGPSSAPVSKRLTRASSGTLSLAMSRALVTPAIRSKVPSTPEKCWCTSHRPGIRKRPAASITSVAGGAAPSSSGSTRTTCSPCTSTRMFSRTARSRGSNRRAWRISSAPAGRCVSRFATSALQAWSAAFCAACSRGSSGFRRSPSTSNQSSITAAVSPFSSSHTGTGVNWMPPMRYSVSTWPPAARCVPRSSQASPAGSSFSRCPGALSSARASTPMNSGGALAGR